MRAFLYACTTAADLGRTVLDEKLPELRRLAGIRGFEIAGEFVDAIPTGVGKRPGFDALCAALSAADGGVLIANSIADLAWDLAEGLARLSAAGLDGERVSLICIRNSFDATTPAGALRLRDALTLNAEHRRDRAHDRQRIGSLRRMAKAAGGSIAGRPRVVLNEMELRSMLEQGLSQREMRARLEALGAPVSKGVLATAVRDLTVAGDFDAGKRAAAIARRPGGSLPRGGPVASGGPIERATLAQLWASGLPVETIAARLSTPTGKVSVWRVRLELGAAREAGELDDAARAEAKERSRARRSRAA